MKEIAAKRGRQRLHYTHVRKRFNSWVTRTKLLRRDPRRNEILCCADTCCTNPFTQETTAPHRAFQNAAFQSREVTPRPFRIIWCLQSTQRQPECLGVTPPWAIQLSKFSCVYKTHPGTSKMWLEAWEEDFSQGHKWQWKCLSEEYTLKLIPFAQYSLIFRLWMWKVCRAQSQRTTESSSMEKIFRNIKSNS